MTLSRILVLLIFCVSCTAEAPADKENGVEDVNINLSAVAEQYVRLALALGEHDEYYVDAYFGPEEWRDEAKQEAKSLDDIATAADSLVAELNALDMDGVDSLLELRQNFLATHLHAMASVSRMRNGQKYSFDEESKAIYGFVAPTFPREHYDQALAKLEELLPGEGPLHERYNAFMKQFEIPADKLELVVTKGIEECRRRTLQHMTLPEGENFVMEMVSGNPWGAYNWYQGNGQGLIQIESSRPTHLGRSIELGCHEGYPGHHVFSSLLDFSYGQERGWVEFSIFPLFAPMGVIFEGSGNYAAKVAFPEQDRLDFLRDVIVPIAGLGEVDLGTRNKIDAIRESIRYARIEAARNYLDGVWSREETVEWLTKYNLVPPEGIDSSIGFIERYRAYTINYVLGQDLVGAYVQANNPDGTNEGEWQGLIKLLSLPPAPMLFE